MTESLSPYIRRPSPTQQQNWQKEVVSAITNETHNLKKISEKSCEICGELIIFKYLELFQKVNPDNYLAWKRVLIKGWWHPFDADNPSKEHQHKMKREGCDGLEFEFEKSS